MGELKKLQWAAWKEKKTPAVMHRILHTEGLGFSGAGCLLLILLPGSWVPGRRVSRKLVKTTMSEKEKQSFNSSFTDSKKLHGNPHQEKNCLMEPEGWNINSHGFCTHSLLWPNTGSAETQRLSKHILLYLNYLQILILLSTKNCVLHKWLL